MSCGFDALAAELVGRGVPVNRCEFPVRTLLIGNGGGIITVIDFPDGWEATATYNAWTTPITGSDVHSAVLAHLREHPHGESCTRGRTGSCAAVA